MCRTKCGAIQMSCALRIFWLRIFHLFCVYKWFCKFIWKFTFFLCDSIWICTQLAFYPHILHINKLLYDYIWLTQAPTREHNDHVNVCQAWFVDPFLPAKFIWVFFNKNSEKCQLTSVSSPNDSDQVCSLFGSVGHMSNGGLSKTILIFICQKFVYSFIHLHDEISKQIKWLNKSSFRMYEKTIDENGGKIDWMLAVFDLVLLRLQSKGSAQKVG